MGLALIAALALTGAEPSTRPVGDAVIVHAAGTCLDRARLLEHVQAGLARDDVDARISVVVSATATTAELTVMELGRPVATRVFPEIPAKCDDLHAALGIAVAVAIEAAIVQQREEAPPTAPPVVMPAPVVAPTPTKPARSSPAPARPRLVDVTLDLSVLGTLRAPDDLGVGGRIDVDVGALSWMFMRFGVVAMDSPSIAIADGHVDALVVAGSAAVCPRRELAPLEIALCNGAQLGVLHARGRDLPGSQASNVLHASFTSGFFVHGWTRTRRVGWLVGGSLHVPLVATTLSVAGTTGTVTRPLSPFGASVSVGLRVGLRTARGTGP